MSATVDNSIQYRGYNTIKMEAPAKLKSWIYGVQGLSAISHGLYVYAPSAIASTTRLKTRWIKSDGTTLSVQNHSFGVTGSMFEWIKVENLEVPSEAVYAITELVNTSGATYWAGLVKSEAGAKATDFTQNNSGQLTKITASGIYTGTIFAEQVIFTDGGDKLSGRMATLNSSMLSLQNATSSNSNAITTIQAGVATLESKTNNNTSAITQIEAGKITLSSSTSGKIAGMTIGTNFLESGSGNSYIRISGQDGYSRLMLGGETWDTVKFGVSSTGQVKATGATIEGNITATSGDIGGFRISNNMLQSSTSGQFVRLSGASGYNPIMVGTSSSNINFKVDTAGNMTCNNATIGGVLNNTTGRHGGSHYGYHEGKAYTSSDSTLRGGYAGTATTWSGSSIGGALNSTGGSHGGSIYSSSGTIGGVPYFATNGLLKFNGGVVIQPSLRVYGTVYHEGLAPLSDIRLKKDIETANKDDYLNSFYNLKVKKFRYKDNPDRYKTLGIIAQDFIADNDSQMIGEVVKANDGYFAVNHDTLFFMAVLAIQELNKRLKRLEDKLNA